MSILLTVILVILQYLSITLCSDEFEESKYSPLPLPASSSVSPKRVRFELTEEETETVKVLERKISSSSFDSNLNIFQESLEEHQKLFPNRRESLEAILKQSMIAGNWETAEVILDSRVVLEVDSSVFFALIGCFPEMSCEVVDSISIENGPLMIETLEDTDELLPGPDFKLAPIGFLDKFTTLHSSGMSLFFKNENSFLPSIASGFERFKYFWEKFRPNADERTITGTSNLCREAFKCGNSEIIYYLLESNASTFKISVLNKLFKEFFAKEHFQFLQYCLSNKVTPLTLTHPNRILLLQWAAEFGALSVTVTVLKMVAVVADLKKLAPNAPEAPWNMALQFNHREVFNEYLKHIESIEGII